MRFVANVGYQERAADGDGYYTHWLVETFSSEERAKAWAKAMMDDDPGLYHTVYIARITTMKRDR